MVLVESLSACIAHKTPGRKCKNKWVGNFSGRKLLPESLRRIPRALCPSLISWCITKLRRGKKDQVIELFDGSGKRFMELVGQCQVYAEYGVGLSTLWVIENFDIPVLAVETSQSWANEIQNHVGISAKLELEWIDLGEIGNWGRPLSYDRSDSFVSYLESPWQRELRPDLILIDGRFRVACFLTCLLKAEVGSMIIFDDYVSRKHYHLVEQFVEPSEFCGRQAVFEVPAGLDLEAILQLRERFEFVFD